MNSSIDNTSTTINAREIPSDERLQLLPRHFGRHMLTVEYAVYAFMRKLTNQYTGGYWHYFELSNGGFYMAPAHHLGRGEWLRGNVERRCRRRYRLSLRLKPPVVPNRAREHRRALPSASRLRFRSRRCERNPRGYRLIGR